MFVLVGEVAHSYLRYDAKQYYNVQNIPMGIVTLDIANGRNTVQCDQWISSANFDERAHGSDSGRTELAKTARRMTSSHLRLEYFKSTYTTYY